MAITGLALIGFVVTHLLGNLFLYQSSGEGFNAYAAKLQSLGALLEIAEVGLVLFILAHIVIGVRLTLTARQARPVKYAVTRTKGGPSLQNLSNTTMVISGIVLFVFILVHLWHFKFGPGVEQGYVTEINGAQTRDLYRLVLESFKNPLWVAGYIVPMIFLGFHLRHGFFSALQSLGWMRDSLVKKIYWLGTLLGVVLALGFLLIPVYMYFFK